MQNIVITGFVRNGLVNLHIDNKMLKGNKYMVCNTNRRRNTLEIKVEFLCYTKVLRKLKFI